jgi:hypothetical protein
MKREKAGKFTKEFDEDGILAVTGGLSRFIISRSIWRRLIPAKIALL